MLYIFLVETGTMKKFIMELAMESVANLKEAINTELGIPVEHQVMLISGGISLESNVQVSTYGAGTDTNPIFLFDLGAINALHPPPIPDLPYCQEDSFHREVQEAASHPPSLPSLLNKCQLAKRLAQEAAYIQKQCEKMSFAHHLQQQGWSAVIANLDDMVKSFKSNAKHFNELYSQHLQKRESNINAIQNFNCDLELYSKIPILECLLGGNAHSMSMLQWMRARGFIEIDKNLTLAEMHDDIKKILDLSNDMLLRCDENQFLSLKEEIEHVLVVHDNPQMKEMKGLNERLYSIDTFLEKVKGEVINQEKFAQNLHQNYISASHLNDKSVLPDLCDTHQARLNNMLEIHKQLLTYQERIVTSKKEITDNLHKRLKWIVYVERMLQEISNKMVIYGETLRRMKNNLEAIQQIHNAPKIYLTALAEVVRRKNFAKVFMQWASIISQNSLEIHSKEMNIRSTFQAQISKHFLKQLFPGIDDMPPPFAVEPPGEFDTSLPNVKPEDLEKLRQILPEISGFLKVSHADLHHISTLAMDSALGSEEVPSSSKIFQKLQRIDTEESIDIVSSLSDASPLRDGNAEGDIASIAGVKKTHHSLDFPKEPPIEEESRLDSEGEEFVEVEGGEPSCMVMPSKSNEALKRGFHLYSPEVPHETSSQEFQTTEFYLDESMPSSISESNGTTPRAQSVKSHHTVVAELQDQLDQKNALIQALQENLRSVKGQLANTCKQLQSSQDQMGCMRLQVGGLREEFQSQMQAAQESLSNLHSHIVNVLLHYDQTQSSLKDCAIQEALSRFQDSEGRKYEEMVAHLTNQHQHQIDALRQEANEKIQQANQEKNNAVNQIMEEFKAREEELVYRTREEAQSKIEKMRQEEQVEAELQRQDSLRSLAAKMEALILSFTPNQAVCIPPSNNEEEMWSSFEQILHNAFSHCSEQAQKEKEEEKEHLNGLLQSLTWELEDQKKLTAQLSQTIETQENMLKKYTLEISDLSNTLSQIRLEKEELEAQLNQRQQSMFEPSTSFAAVSESTMEESIQKEDPRDKEIALLKQKLMSTKQCDKVSVITCTPGDVVMVCYDEKHESYMIFMLGSNLHFLHTDCLETMGLKTEGDEKKKQKWTLGEVVDKEYCQAKKSINRYKVPVGTKFYRVKVKPWNREAAVRRGRRETLATSQLASTSNRASEAGTTSENMALSSI